MRRTILLLSASLLAAACHRQVRRTAGDEAPYPAVDEPALDRNVSPCQDFYQFACGRWVAETEVPRDRTRWVRGQGEVEERNARLLRRILEDAGAGRVDTHARFGRKAGDFYAACMAEADVEASGLADLQAEWARLDAVTDRLELGDELCRLAAMGIRAPLGVRTRPDPGNPLRNLLVVGAGGVGVATSLEEGVAAQARSSPPRPDAEQGQPGPLLEHVRAMLRLGRFPAAQVDQEAAAAVELERALEGVPSGAPPAAIGSELQPVDRAALQRLAPGFPWSRFLRAMGADHLDPLGMEDGALVARVGQQFEQAPLASWKAYLRVRLAEAMAAERALPSPMVQEWFRFQGTLAPAPAELRPRWKDCVDATARAFPLTVGGAFARRYLRPSGRERAGWLVSSVQRGMRVTLEGAPWVDAATQSRGAAKLERMAVQIGYPDAPAEYKALRVGRESYFRNVLSAGRFAVAQEVARASRPPDRGEWMLGPFAAEPAYWPARNVLCVPAGALQPPVYNPDAPDPVVFGAMGSAIGRRLAEALEGAGRLRGPDGTPGDWWTPAASSAFEAKAACLVEQVDGYEPVPGVRLDGRRALAAELADLAGLRAAYEAMRSERITHPGTDKRVSGFTPDQQFFVGYAQSLCTSATDADATEQAGQGAHPPARFRVNGPLSNLPEFAKAFRCDEGSPMVRPPAARCDVW